MQGSRIKIQSFYTRGHVVRAKVLLILSVWVSIFCCWESLFLREYGLFVRTYTEKELMINYMDNYMFICHFCAIELISTLWQSIHAILNS